MVKDRHVKNWSATTGEMFADFVNACLTAAQTVSGETVFHLVSLADFPANPHLLECSWEPLTMESPCKNRVRNSDNFVPYYHLTCELLDVYFPLSEKWKLQRFPGFRRAFIQVWFPEDTTPNFCWAISLVLFTSKDDKGASAGRPDSSASQ